MQIMHIIILEKHLCIICRDAMEKTSISESRHYWQCIVKREDFPPTVIPQRTLCTIWLTIGE